MKISHLQKSSAIMCSGASVVTYLWYFEFPTSEANSEHVELSQPMTVCPEKMYLSHGLVFTHEIIRFYHSLASEKKTLRKWLNPLPHDKILDCSKLKQIADIL